MILAQGRFWRAQVHKGSKSVTLTILRDDLPLEVEEVRELRIDVPLADWNRVVKYTRADRKLLGGILLDFAKHKDRLAAAIGHDGLYLELETVLVDATVSLVQGETLGLAPITKDE